METFATIVAGGLQLVILVGSIMLVVAGFRTSVWWGFGNLLIPFWQLVFTIKFWDQAKMGCLLQIIPFIVLVPVVLVFSVGAAVMQLGEESAGDSELVVKEGGSSGATERTTTLSTGRGSSSTSTTLTGTGGGSGSPSFSSPSSTKQQQRPAPKPRRTSTYRDIRVEELPAAIGKNVKIELNDGRERVGKLLSISEKSLRIEQRVSRGKMEFPVTLTDIKRARVLESSR
jgi:hypothetical protein